MKIDTAITELFESRSVKRKIGDIFHLWSNVKFRSLWKTYFNPEMLQYLTGTWTYHLQNTDLYRVAQ